jgi:hypothetical protein
VCHGATRGGGMLFPCLGTLAQHVQNAALVVPQLVPLALGCTLQS